LRREEPEPVYRELVDALADNVVPMVIPHRMTIATGVHIWSIVPSRLVAAASLLCVVTMVVKIVTILHHQRHRVAYRRASLDRVRRHERGHAVTTIAVCLSIALFSVAVYALPYPALHLLPVAIAFCYSAGLIARVSIRPHIASSAILSLMVPNALAIALLGKDHVFVAVILMVFAVAGLQSVAFVYATARGAVRLRLELEALARHDPLTGVLNRLGLREALAGMTADASRPVVVHALDLDGFKGVNDRFGHGAGDRLLVVLAARIQASVRDGTIVARTGGDEFVMVQHGDAAAARDLAERIHDQLIRPYDLGLAEPVTIGVSLGYATGLLPEATLEGLIQQADARSYAVKRRGGGILGIDEPADPPMVASPPVRALTRQA